jgi:SLT domain-containing protein
MADEIFVGSVAVGIVPDARGLPEKLRQELVPSAGRIGEEMGTSMTDGIRSKLDVGKAVADSSARGKASEAKAGEAAGGAFGDAFRKRLEAALKALPKAKIDADSSEAEKELEKLRIEMEELSKKKIGVDMTADEAKAQLAELSVGLEDLHKSAKNIDIKFNTTRAMAELIPLRREIDKLGSGAGGNLFTRIRRSLGGAGGGGGGLGAALGGAGGGGGSAAGGAAGGGINWFGSVFGTSAGPALIGGLIVVLLSVLPAVTPLLIGLGTAMGGVLIGALLDKGFKKGLLGIFAEIKNVMSVVVQPIIEAFTKLMPLIDVGIENLGPLLRNLFAASTPFLGMFVRFLFQAAQVLLPVFTRALRQLTPYLPQLSRGLLAIVRGLGAMITAMGPRGIRDAVTVLVAILIGLGGVLAGVGKLANLLAIYFAQAGNHIRVGWNQLTGFIALGYHQMLQIWNALFDFFRKFPERFRGFFAAAGRWLVSAGRDLIMGLWHGIDGFWLSTIDPWWNRIRQRFVGYLVGAIRWLVSAGTAVGQGLWNGIRNFWNNTIAPFWSGLRHRIAAFFSGALQWLLTAGGDVIEGFLHGILAKITGIASWIKVHVVDPVVNAVKHFFGIHSPSTVFRDIGFNIIAGLIHGVLSGASNLTGFVTQVFGSMLKALAHLVEKSLVDIAQIPAKLLAKLAGFIGSILSKVGGFFSKLAHFFGGSGGGVQRWASVVLQALRMLGLPAAYLGLVLDQMNSESGGNPDAVNLSDINAQEGHPSVGLMQVIRGTFDAYAGPFRNVGPFAYGVSENPLANVYAALNYGEHGAGFGRGPGQIGSMHGYDSGGWLMPGLNFAGFNGIGQPEPVLTPDQWDSISTLAQNGAAATQLVPLMRQQIRATQHVGADVGAELTGTTRRSANRRV